MAKKRTDAERRARQCERLAKLLRVLQCILGPGRWDVESLAKELECSTRTIHRLLQTLSMAGVPWHFDPELQAYRVRKGYKFPALEIKEIPTGLETGLNQKVLLDAARRTLSDGEQFLQSVRRFTQALTEKK